MILFLDTNVLLDVLANRQPFVTSSKQLWELSESNDIKGMISAITFNNVYYIVRKASSPVTASECLRKLRSIFGVVEVDDKIIHQALDSTMSDFEDAIQYFCSLRCKATHLVTRNPGDFPTTKAVLVVTPEVFLSSWNSRENG